MDAGRKGKEKVVEGEKKNKRNHREGFPFEPSQKRALVATEESLALISLPSTDVSSGGMQPQFNEAMHEVMVGVSDLNIGDLPQVSKENSSLSVGNLPGQPEVSLEDASR